MRFLYKVYFSIRLFIMINLIGREIILEEIESKLVLLYMRSVDFHVFKDCEEGRINHFILAYVTLATDDLSWFFPKLRSEIIEKVFLKCSRKTKWEISLIKE